MTPQILDLLWEKSAPVLYISKEEYLAELNGWDITPVEIDGQLSFITVVKGPLFHFVSLGTKQRIRPSMIREFLGRIVSAHGYAETRTPVEDVRQQRFNLAYGFQEVGQDGFDIIYRIDRI